MVLILMLDVVNFVKIMISFESLSVWDLDLEKSYMYLVLKERKRKRNTN